MSRLRLDLTPLRASRDFRRLLGAGAVFHLGQMVTYTVVPAQLEAMTRSNAAVGALGAAEAVPLVVFGLWGGALADHVDRRRLLVLTGAAQVVLAALLLANAARAHPSTGAIFALAALSASAGALQRPSREALLPRVVGRGQLPAAVSLNSLVMQSGMLVGPAVGGLLFVTVGPAWAYAVDLAGLVVATALLSRLGAHPHTGETERPSLRGIADGLRYAVRRRDLLGTYVVDLAAMTLAYPIAVFPAWARDDLRHPGALGLLTVAGSVGGLVATSSSGWTARVPHRGRAIVVAAACWGAATALAGVTTALWFVLGALALAGGADALSGLFRTVVWHETIPDGLRGRLAGIEMLSYSLGPLAGQLRAGFVADAVGVRASIVSGGAMCVVGVVLVALLLPAFWAYDARRDPAVAPAPS